MRLWFLVVLTLLGGCSSISVSYHSRTPQTFRPRDPSTIAIYTLTPPGLRYDVIGTLRADDASLDLAPGPALLAQIRSAAADYGCSAILIDHGFCVEEGTHTMIGASTSSLEAECIEVRR